MTCTFSMAMLLLVRLILGYTAAAADEVKICYGIVTSNGTCIGSESNVPPPTLDCDDHGCWYVRRR